MEPWKEGRFSGSYTFWRFPKQDVRSFPFFNLIWRWRNSVKLYFRWPKVWDVWYGSIQAMGAIYNWDCHFNFFFFLNWIRCRWGNIQKKKKRVQIYNIQKEYFISTKLLWSGTFRQQKQETWGNRFTCETKKETSENQYQNMARPLPDSSGPSRWKTSDQIQAQAKDDVQCGRFILEIDNPITEQDICQAIRKLKSGRASGLNNISSKIGVRPVL